MLPPVAVKLSAAGTRLARIKYAGEGVAARVLWKGVWFEKTAAGWTKRAFTHTDWGQGRTRDKKC